MLPRVTRTLPWGSCGHSDGRGGGADAGMTGNTVTWGVRPYIENEMENETKSMAITFFGSLGDKGDPPCYRVTSLTYIRLVPKSLKYPQNLKG